MYLMGRYPTQVFVWDGKKSTLDSIKQAGALVWYSSTNLDSIIVKAPCSVAHLVEVQIGELVFLYYASSHNLELPHSVFKSKTSPLSTDPLLDTINYGITPKYPTVWMENDARGYPVIYCANAANGVWTRQFDGEDKGGWGEFCSPHDDADSKAHRAYAAVMNNLLRGVHPSNLGFERYC